MALPTKLIIRLRLSWPYSHKLKLKLREHQLEDQFKDVLTKLEATVFRISKIVAGLRTFARDGAKDALVYCDTQTVISDLVSLCAERFRANGVALRLPDITQTFDIHVRPVQIGQVLINLLNNSFDAVADLEHKWVDIDVVRREQFVEISITDSGTGIPEHIRDKIMDPFFTTKPIGQGTGLGLSISDGIIRDHGGQIVYDKTCKNTRFVIRLPQAVRPSDTAAA